MLGHRPPGYVGLGEVDDGGTGESSTRTARACLQAEGLWELVVPSPDWLTSFDTGALSLPTRVAGSLEAHMAAGEMSEPTS